MTSPVSSVMQSVTAKLVVIVFLTCLLVVPLGMVWALVAERAERRDDVVAEVGAIWGRQQTVGSVALSVPFDTVSVAGGVATRTSRRAVVLPSTLTIEADLVPEVRRRSIFSVNLYRTSLRVSGTFAIPDIARLGVTPETVRWQQATFDAGVTDLRGMVSVTPLDWGGEPIALEPSAGDGPLGPGLRAITPVRAGAVVPFRLEMVVAGSDRLMFMPSGADTHVTLRSSWTSPGFTGSLLPLAHEIGPDGFQAEWRSNHLARPLPQAWIDTSVDPRTIQDKAASSAFGLNLVTTIDHYRQTERAVKYGVLFIALTFAVFLVWDLVERLRLHPVQYLLVGLALIVFYLLLLSLSEQLRFAAAYGTAAAATVALVAGYASRVLAAGRRGLAMAGWLGLLYGLLYVLLSLEDLALLVGSIVVFLALAAVMYFTRGVDWYGTRDPGATRP